MTPKEQILENVMIHTICILKVEEEGALFSKFSYEYRFCEDEEIKDENTIYSYAPAFTLTLPNKEDCSSAEIRLNSNLGHILFNVLELNITSGCPICVLRDVPEGMTISEFIRTKIDIEDGLVH